MTKKKGRSKSIRIPPVVINKEQRIIKTKNTEYEIEGINLEGYSKINLEIF